MRCLILMTTYNGEKFIGQQIESICNQSFRDWHLIIRDDGSKDRTISVIQFYMAKDSRIELIKNETKQHGAYLNLWTLIKYAKNLPAYDYYFFADQDDVWLSDKLEEMISAIEGKKDKPVLAYTDMQVVDGEGKLIYQSLNDIVGISEIGKYSEFFAHGYVSGCVAVINRKLFEATPVFPLDSGAIKIMSHDNYYTKFALVLGEVEYLDFPVIQYRRHGDNVTSGNQYKLDLKKIYKKATGVFGELAKTHGRVYAQTLLTFEQMRKVEAITPDIVCIEEGIKAGGLKGVSVLKKYHVHRKQMSRTIGLYVVMLLGTYKKYMKEFMEMETDESEISN